MKKEIFQEIEIPEEVEVEIDGGILTVKGPEGQNTREFDLYKIKMEKKQNKIRIGSESSTKREKKKTNTIAAHIRNMLKGVQEKYIYTVKICSSHFPMTVDINGRDVKVKNYLGEKIPRTTRLPEGVETEIKGEIITIKSTDKEKAGHAAAKLEASTKISNRDRRIFQDGLYITSKAGREI